MRVYLRPPQPSRGLERIAGALRRHLPAGWSEVATQTEADLVVLYAIGRYKSLTQQAQAISCRGQRFALVQVCLRSTQKPDTSYWWKYLWQQARVVWSYYDLRRAVDIDGWEVNDFDDTVNFYHAPLGADAGVFHNTTGPFTQYKIITTGLSRLSESVRECHLAVAETNKQSIGMPSCHLGAKLNLGEHVDCYTDIDDEQLAYLYSQCQWVSGLRRKEGFELPAVEGLLCGARPILFNTPDYRKWYEPFGVFIEETDRQGVVDQLVELFKRGPKLVTDEEIALACERFDWAKIVGGFYERITSD